MQSVGMWCDHDVTGMTTVLCTVLNRAISTPQQNFTAPTASSTMVDLRSLTTIAFTASFRSIERSSSALRSVGSSSSNSNSVSGPIYTDPTSPIVIQLFTKHGCTLCDQVQLVLAGVRETHPHSLEAVDITDEKNWWDRYKYDIPVLHLNQQYWTKHRLTPEQAREGIESFQQGKFISPIEEEPNAAKYESKRRES